MTGHCDTHLKDDETWTLGGGGKLGRKGWICGILQKIASKEPDHQQDRMGWGDEEGCNVGPQAFGLEDGGEQRLGDTGGRDVQQQRIPFIGYGTSLRSQGWPVTFPSGT